MSRTSSRSEPIWSAGPCVERGQELDRLADVAQRVVDRVRQGVDLGRLAPRRRGPGSCRGGPSGRAPTAAIQPAWRASRSGSFAAVAPSTPTAVRRWPGRSGDVAAPRRPGGDRPIAPVSVGVRLDRRRAGSSPGRRARVGAGARARRRRSRGRRASRPGPAGEEVGVERDDHVGPVEVVDRLERPRRRPARRPARTASRVDRLVAVPLRLGELPRAAAGAGRPGSAR